MSQEVSSMLERIGSSAEIWSQRIQKMFASQSRLNGTFFAGDRERLRELAAARGVHHLDNLAGCPAS